MLQQKREKVDKLKDDYLDEVAKEQNSQNTRNLP